MDLIENDSTITVEHWYYEQKFKCIFEAIQNHLPDFETLTDIGAGKALFLQKLCQLFPDRFFLGMDKNYSDEDLSHSQLPNLRLSRTISSSDIYIMTDVLEHIEDDLAFLTDLRAHLETGSLLLITVPANMALWSGHDEFLGHYRRYSVKGLRSVLENSSFEILEMRHIYKVLFLPVLILRRIFSHKKKSQMKSRRFVDFVISLLMNIEKFLKPLPLPGVSIWVVARPR